MSAFGEEVIAEMNRLGIMVDVSHISKAAMLDAVQLSKAPAIASHSSTRALADVARNMDDEQLRALAENGGVMQTVALGSYVKNPPEKRAAMDELLAELGISSMGGLSELSDEKRAELMAKRAELDEEWPPATVGISSITSTTRSRSWASTMSASAPISTAAAASRAGTTRARPSA